MDQNSIPKSEVVVLDVGRQRRKAIKDLKQGIGPLMDEVEAATRAVAEPSTTADQKVVPVVLLYRKRSKRQRGLISSLLRAL